MQNYPCDTFRTNVIGTVQWLRKQHTNQQKKPEADNIGRGKKTGWDVFPVYVHVRCETRYKG